MSSCYNRQVCPLLGFIVSAHTHIEMPRPPVFFLFLTPPSPHRLYDLQDTLDKLMHFLPQLSDFVSLKNGFYSFRVQTD